MATGLARVVNQSVQEAVDVMGLGKLNHFSFRDGKQLLIGCVKNPVGKATNGRDMKKENWTKQIFNSQQIPLTGPCQSWLY